MIYALYRNRVGGFLLQRQVMVIAYAHSHKNCNSVKVERIMGERCLVFLTQCYFVPRLTLPVVEGAVFKIGDHACSAHFCHLNHFCHSSPVLSIHINRFCQPHHFCQLLSTQSSPVLSTILTTYVQLQTRPLLLSTRPDHFCQP